MVGPQKGKIYCGFKKKKKDSDKNSESPFSVLEKLSLSVTHHCILLLLLLLLSHFSRVRLCVTP